MALSKKISGDAVVLVLDGKLSIGPSVEAFRNAWMDAVRDGAKHIVIDLSHVPIVDSSGIGSMIRCNSSLAANGGKVKIVGAADIVRQAFKVTRLDQVFEFYDSEASALGGKSATA